MNKMEMQRNNINLYKEADCLEKITVFDLNGCTLDEKLDHLQKEIKLRINITQREIFKIGELLTHAKKICAENKISFKDWVSDNDDFDFSYETANNFRNVFKHCFANQKLAEAYPPSILYKVSSPNFPNELREHIFENIDPDHIKNKTLRSLLNKYKENGMKGIDQDLEKFSKQTIVDRQIKYTLQQFEFVSDLISKSKGKLDRTFLGFDVNIASHEKDAQEIQRILYDAIEKVEKDLKRSGIEAQKIYDTKVKVEL